MIEQNPLIDIIVPVYNGAKYIPGFLERMEKQADIRARFLFVDDGSEDESVSILLEAKAACRLPMEIISRKHAGVSAARNAGIEAAEAEYIAFFDVDDTCSGDYISTLLKEADRGGFDVLVFEYTGIYSNADSVPESRGSEACRIRKEDLLKSLLLDAHRCMMAVWILLLRRDFVLKSGVRFAEGYPYYEDCDFLYRTVAVAGRIERLNRPLYGYVVLHGSSAIARFTPERLRCLELFQPLEQFLAETVPDFALLFRQYAAARVFWSVLWQAALAAPSKEVFMDFSNRSKAVIYMLRLKGHPDRKVRLIRLLFLFSRGLYYRAACLLGKRFSALGKASAETMNEAARLCPDPETRK